MNLHRVSHRCHDMVDYWFNFRWQQGVPLFGRLIRSEHLNAGLQNLASRNWRHRSVVRYNRAKQISISWTVYRMDHWGQTSVCRDGRTDMPL